MAKNGLSNVRQVSINQFLISSKIFSDLDTSGKLPASFIEATHTAIGDFTECLEPSGISSRPVSSQYCMVEIFPERPPTEVPGKIHVAHKRTCVNCPFFQGLCLPDVCSQNDIRNLVNSGWYRNIVKRLTNKFYSHQAIRYKGNWLHLL